MDKRIEKIIKELGVTVYFDDELEAKGKYVPILNIVVINNKQDDFEKIKVLLHELGHACEDKDDYELYKKTYALKSKMETKANDFMINTIIEENGGVYNYSQLIEEFNIGMGYDVRFVQ